MMPGQMRVLRLPLMVRRRDVVHMHVRQRRSDGAGLHEQGEGGGGQPSKHTGIVVNDLGSW